MKYPTKKEIINSLKSYINRIENEKIPREKIDTAFVLKNILGNYYKLTIKE